MSSLTAVLPCGRARDGRLGGRGHWAPGWQRHRTRHFLAAVSPPVRCRDHARRSRRTGRSVARSV